MEPGRRRRRLAPTAPLVCCAALLLGAGCRSAEPVIDLDRRQTATCTVFLPDGALAQPECWLHAGDLFDDGNGQLLITVAGDGGVLAGGLVAPPPWDVRIKGPLHVGTFGLAALDAGTAARVSVVESGATSEYALIPGDDMTARGNIELRLLRVDSHPAQIGPRLLSTVGGSVDLTFAAVSDPMRTVVARASF